MLELGKIQNLKVIREAPIGVYLDSEGLEEVDAILLPKKQVPEHTQIDDIIEVFVYRDSEDRLIATTRTPKIKVGELAVLKVVAITKIGAFLDWGLEKDLFLPFKKQLGYIKEGNSYIVGLYVDKQNRLCATMKIYDLLSSSSPFEKGDIVNGTVYKVNDELGVFVAVENKYHGLILNKEAYRTYSIGESISVRVKSIREDGKLELSERQEAYKEIESDSNKIIELLDMNNGVLSLNDKSDPEEIKSKLNISKKAFKRAIGRLLKEGVIDITDNGIKKSW